MADQSWPKKMLVSVPVADLRREPKDGNGTHDEDPLQETQVFLGERLLAHEEKDGWLRVEALEQEEFTHDDRWQGYPGWIRKDQVVEVDGFWNASPDLVVTVPWAVVYANAKLESDILLPVTMGTLFVGKIHSQDWREVKLPDGRKGFLRSRSVRKLLSEQPQDENRMRENIIKTAKGLLGGPYFWGGRSAYNPELKNQVTSLDCSGLVNLSYRANGLMIPRDAHEQFMKSEKMKSGLKPGDLVFLAKPEKPERMVHVMMYIGQDKLLEAAGQAHRIRVISGTERLGKPVEAIISGENTGERVVYFGSYLASHLWK